MRKRIFKNNLGAHLLGCAAVIAFGAGCGKNEIKVYSAPKDNAPVPQMVAAAAQNGIAADPNASPIHWKTPPGWKELEPTSMRVGNFLVSNGEKKAEVSIIPFPGNTGSEVDNVNRWRREIGLAPIGEKDVSSEKVSIGADEGKLYDMTGAQLQTLAGFMEKDGTSWFFKMRGDKELVAQNKPAFVEFLKSIHFDSAHSDEPAVAAKPVSTNIKHVPDEGSSGEPKWEIPENWQKAPATPMILKNFSVGEGEHEARISISVFPGDVGGPLANVNRWRGQLSLEPIDEAGLAKLTTSIDVFGGKATLVDMTGTDGKTGKPARMIAAMVPRKEQTWFYKMMGDDSTVAREKEAFVKFVQTAHYPND